MRLTMHQMVASFEARNLRERALIAITALALTWALWLVSVGGYVFDSQAEVITEIERLAAELRMQNQEHERLQQSDQPSERVQLSERRDLLQGVLAEQAAALDALIAQFVAPQEVPRLLEDMLESHGGLTLVRLASQPPELLDLGEARGPAAVIYRHPVVLEFEGGYLDVVAYLQALERGDWQFKWRRLDYVVQTYPVASVTIEVETLSQNREWLGV